MEVLTAVEIKAFLQRMATLVQEQKDELTQLDSVIGDGDLGLTMTKGFTAIAESVETLEEEDVGKLLAKAGMVIASAAPSTMGTLMATGLMRGGKAVQGKSQINLTDLAALFQAFVGGIMDRGKAKPGDKTVLDALYPAAMALQSAADAEKSLAEGIQEAFQAACDGLEQTKKLISQHGKAACFQEKTLGHQDPGATVGMLLFKALATMEVSHGIN